MPSKGQQIFTTLEADGRLTIELADSEFPDPTGNEVLVRVEASPINPSDLILLFDHTKLAGAEYSPGKIVVKLTPEAAERAKGRFGQRLPVGNEAAGTVVAAGPSPAAQALLNRRVACLSGSAYATYAVADAARCIPIPDDVPAELGAASYVNPMTVLGFVETMKRDGYKAIIHLAAASNLGRMLNRVCLEDGIPLVNVVRKQEHVDLLRSEGAKIVLNSSEPDFEEKLRAVIAETEAYMGFDPIGGGTLTDTCLRAMEAAAASKMTVYSRYGSSQPKTMYIYGALDMSPTVITRSYGFTWTVAGWLLTTILVQSPEGTMQRLWSRAVANLHTLFKSEYKARVTLAGMLEKGAAEEYAAMRSGEKYVVTP